MQGHYILYANEFTLLKRLNKRFRRGDTWEKGNIERCINAFDNYITEHKIITDEKSIDDVVKENAEKSGVAPLADTFYTANEDNHFCCGVQINGTYQKTPFVHYYWSKLCRQIYDF
jgi:hypothetical protein